VIRLYLFRICCILQCHFCLRAVGVRSCRHLLGRRHAAFALSCTASSIHVAPSRTQIDCTAGTQHLQITRGLHDKYGAARVKDTPITEVSFCSLACSIYQVAVQLPGSHDKPHVQSIPLDLASTDPHEPCSVA
jgi:hypothetical protein